MEYAIFDDNGEITGFVENTPDKAKQAAKEHILMSMKFDDPTNYEYWNNKITGLGL